MSDGTDGDIRERSPEEKLRALVRKDIDPRITELAKRALERRQQERDRDV